MKSRSSFSGIASAIKVRLANLALYIFAGDLLSFWLREPVSSDTIFAMRALTISIVPGGIFEIWIPALVGIGHLKALTVSSIISAIAAILLAIILSFKVVALPFAPALTLAVVLWLRSGIWLPWYGLRKMRISFPEYLKKGLLSPLVAGGISILALYFYFDLWVQRNNSPMLNIVICVLIVMLFYVMISLRREVVELLNYGKKRFQRTGDR